MRDLGRFLYGAAATTSTLVFERDGYGAIDPKSGRARWEHDHVKDVAGIAGMTSRDLFLTGDCPITSAD